MNSKQSSGFLPSGVVGGGSWNVTTEDRERERERDRERLVEIAAMCWQS